MYGGMCMYCCHSEGILCMGACVSNSNVIFIDNFTLCNYTLLLFLFYAVVNFVPNVLALALFD